MLVDEHMEKTLDNLFVSQMCLRLILLNLLSRHSILPKLVWLGLIHLNLLSNFLIDIPQFCKGKCIWIQKSAPSPGPLVTFQILAHYDAHVHTRVSMIWLFVSKYLGCEWSGACVCPIWSYECDRNVSMCCHTSIWKNSIPLVLEWPFLAFCACFSSILWLHSYCYFLDWCSFAHLWYSIIFTFCLNSEQRNIVFANLYKSFSWFGCRKLNNGHYCTYFY